jgi:hypothetical protein
MSDEGYTADWDGRTGELKWWRHSPPCDSPPDLVLHVREDTAPEVSINFIGYLIGAIDEAFSASSTLGVAPC